jgi:hypothetical protein
MVVMTWETGEGRMGCIVVVAAAVVGSEYQEGMARGLELISKVTRAN